MAAAFMVVPSLLAVFHRLSRLPAPRPDQDGAGADGPGVTSPSAASAASVAEEAERWLRSQR